MKRLPQVLCLGEVLFDCLADQPGQPLTAVTSWTPYLGGAPANVAAALVKLGTPAAFLGCVGDDAVGKRAIAELAAAGIDLQGIQVHPQAPTRQVYVTRSAQGDRTFAGFGQQLATTVFADTHLQAAQLPEFLFATASYLVLGTLELAYPHSRAAIWQAVELAKRQGVKILVDVNWRPIFWPEPDLAPELIQALLQQADFWKLSQEEAEWLFQTTEPDAILKQVATVPTGVLITAGEQGCTYAIGERVGQVPAFPVAVVDTTGAGDGFVAGFVHQLCLHENKLLTDPELIRRMVLYASAVGALTTMKPGAIAAQPTATAVEAFLAAQSML